MVTACLCLHSLCKIHGNEFDVNEAKSIEEELKKVFLQNFGDFGNPDLLHVLGFGIIEMTNIQVEVVQVEYMTLTQVR